MANEDRPSDRNKDPNYQDRSKSTPSPGSARRVSHRPQIPLPFAPDAGHQTLGEHEQLHAILAALPVVLFVLDRHANFIQIQGSGLDFLTNPLRQLVGRSFFELSPESPDARERFAQVLEGQSVRWTDRLGERVFEMNLSPLRQRGEIITGVMGIGIETSRRLAVDGDTQGETNGSSSVEESAIRSSFLARASHELRAPLNSIVGFAGLLSKNAESHSGEQDLFYVQRILGNATHLLGVVSGMLASSALETGKLKIEVSETDIGALVEETIAELQGHARAGTLNMRVEIPDDVIPIRTDRQKLKQVLINLLANALKFTKQGSIIVRVFVDEDRCPLRIDVSDSGVGIPADRLETIFAASDRGGRGADQNVEGAGLGLAISRSLCDVMGYKIHAESELGKGSTFTVELSRPAVSSPS
jgi:signal transduction histidine kinase